MNTRAGALIEKFTYLDTVENLSSVWVRSMSPPNASESLNFGYRPLTRELVSTYGRPQCPGKSAAKSPAAVTESSRADDSEYVSSSPPARLKDDVW